jgi:class 3 adenylate cyclase
MAVQHMNMAAAGNMRRLCAILAADVAGYSRLMSSDEDGTLAALTAHRHELIDPSVAGYSGRIVKTTGDGMLVEFVSATDAAECAVEIQRRMARRNADVDSERQIQFRIGINLGDVIIDTEDVFGDGVNIAARLEGLAEPGEVYISGGIYEQIKHKIVCGYESLGDRKVKNITDPIRVYRVLPDPAAFNRTRARRQNTLIISLSLLLLAGAGGVLWYFIAQTRSNIRYQTAAIETSPTLPSPAESQTAPPIAPAAPQPAPAAVPDTQPATPPAAAKAVREP